MANIRYYGDLWLGDPIDALLAKRLANSAIKGPLNGVENMAAGGPKTVYSYEVIDSYRKMASLYSLDASLSYNWVSGGGDITMSLVQEATASAHSVVIAGQVVVTLGESRLPGQHELNFGAKARLAVFGPEKFFERYGSHYVDSICRGGEYRFAMVIETSSASEKQKLEVSLNFSALVAAFNAEQKNLIIREIGSRRTYIWAQKNGGKAFKIPTVDTLVTEWAAFPEEVINDPNKAVVFSAGVQSYSQLAALDPWLNDLELLSRKQDLEALGGLYRDWQDAKAQIDAAILDPEVFDPEQSDATLMAWRKKCSDTIARIHAEAKKAQGLSSANLKVEEILSVKQALPQLGEVGWDNAIEVIVDSKSRDGSIVNFPIPPVPGKKIDIRVPDPSPQFPQVWTHSENDVPQRYGPEGDPGPKTFVPRMPGQNMGMLIANVNGSFEQVGKGREILVPEGGIQDLRLLMNDSLPTPENTGNYADNGGQMLVQVVVRPA